MVSPWNPPDSEPTVYFAPVASPFDADKSALEAYYTGDCMRWQMTIAQAEEEEALPF